MALFTKAQQQAILRLYQRSPPKSGNSDLPISFLAFRRAAQYSHTMGCVMIQWCNMWIGIESDGYTHS